ncbi:MFS transporter [Flexibacterium corallicola]|uniref:MFS transporter n=1 Tax=Flexibacterium corallicola TaxID=3037259 RepID=UPI00286F7B80|nr:MFS transporter [Pseudovibrio sp. M1P-2-3]
MAPIVQNSLMRRNLPLLLAANGILAIQLPALIATGGLAGAYLAPLSSLSTLPLTMQMLGLLMGAVPLSLFMGRFGRKPGFLMGSCASMIGGGVATFALLSGSFWLLCFGHFLFGISASAVGLFRFAAADAATERWKSTALSLAMTMGLVAALVAPQIVKATRDVFEPIPFAGIYLAISVVGFLSALPTLFINLPIAKKAQEVHEQRPPLREILRRPAISTAIVGGVVSYGVMTLVMVPTPLAMAFCGFDVDPASEVIGWHVIAMFAPSFFTGILISRFGAPLIISLGMVLLTASCLTLYSGVELFHFYGGLILLGLGWNFGFVGASSYLNANLKDNERPAMQGLNDTLVGLATVIASLVSGVALENLGWENLVLLCLPLFAMCLLYIGAQSLRQRPVNMV